MPPRAEVDNEPAVEIERTFSAEEWDAIRFVTGDSMYVQRRVEVAARATATPVRTRPVLRGVERWRGLVERYDWNADDALAVMSCESGGDPTARNGTSRGLMQVNAPWHEQKILDAGGVNEASLDDPEINIAVAYAIWSDGRTFAAWSCRP